MPMRTQVNVFWISTTQVPVVATTPSVSSAATPCWPLPFPFRRRRLCLHCRGSVNGPRCRRCGPCSSRQDMHLRWPRRPPPAPCRLRLLPPRRGCNATSASPIASVSSRTKAVASQPKLACATESTMKITKRHRESAEDASSASAAHQRIARWGACCRPCPSVSATTTSYGHEKRIIATTSMPEARAL